ncbi:hypothetical protein, partial [Bacillus pumilus]|uniref:hypothetical protein n=1 Tax=Bacillus pumilus TaxID=1408 RepID=UPI001C92CABE
NTPQDTAKKPPHLNFHQINKLIRTSKINQTFIPLVHTAVHSPFTHLTPTLPTHLPPNLIPPNKHPIHHNPHPTHLPAIIAAEPDNHYS